MAITQPQDRALDLSIDDDELTPEELKRRKENQHLLAEAAYLDRYQQRIKRAIWVGAVGSAVISAFVPGSWFWPIFMGLLGGYMGYDVVQNNRGPLFGIMAFGGSAMLISLTHINVAGIKDVLTGCIIVSTWLFHMALGWVVTTLSQEQRSREESF